MQDHRIRLERRRCPPVLPCRAKQDERRVSALDVQGNCTATGRTDNYIRFVLIVGALSSADGKIEIIIVQCWIDDLVASVLEERRFNAADDTVPAMEEKDLHR